MSHHAIQSILTRLDADMGASEAHGIASGMLCVDVRADIGNWLRELQADGADVDEEDREMLDQLFEQTRKLLHDESDSFEFDLLLADDDEPLTEQAESLRSWCQGFLFGIGYQHNTSNWPGDSDEILQDMIEFTKIDSEISDDEDENALAEIREYLRAAVVTVKEQFADNQPAIRH